MLAQARRLATQKYMIALGIFATILTVAALGPRFSFSIGIEGNLLPTLRDTPTEEQTPTPIDPTLLLICGGTLVWTVLVALHMLRRVLVGSLITGTEQQMRVGTSSFELAWGPAWHKKWSLLALSLTANLPLLILLLLLAIRLGSTLVFLSPFQVLGAQPDLAWLFSPLELSIAVVLWGALSLWRLFADRALLLGQHHLFAAAAEGVRMLVNHAPAAVGLYIASATLMLLLSGMFFIGGVYVVACFLLWPSMLAILGIAQAFLSTYWTVLYQRWAGHAAD